jgi:hypothetical protein
MRADDRAVDLHHHAEVRKSKPVSGLRSSSRTKNADEPLSATVSANVIFQSAMRLSTI